MADLPTPVKPPSGLTFRIAAWILGFLLAVEGTMIGWSLATRSVPGIPEPRASADGAGAVGEPEMEGYAEEELAAEERRLVEALGTFEGKERIGATAGTGGEAAIAEAQPAGRTSDIGDPAARELHAVGRALRADGEMMGALEKFRAADARLPGHPRILYELASAYATMGLTDKAATFWAQIRDMGPEKAGDVYAIADLKLLGESEVPPMRPMTVLYVNQALSKTHPEVAEGEQVTIRLALKARDGVTVDGNAVYLDARFYDITTGGSVEPSPSNPARWEWKTQPADWKEQPEEVLDLVYFRADGSEPEAPGRRYYGFLVKVYYQDVLQDIYTEPRTLVDDISRRSGAPGGGESLFPQD